MIRIATLDDVMMAVDWVEYLCRAVDGQMAVNRPWTANVVANLIQSPEALVLISGNADRGGMLAASLQPTVINPAKVAMEHAWVANDRSGLRLLRAFEGWAAERGAVMVKMSTGAAGPDLGRLGYTMTEQNWVKSI